MLPESPHLHYLKIAIGEALAGIRKGDGGPFGAVIVQEERVLARAHNEVVKRNDPTAHAEMLAIRAAARKLGRFDMGDCLLYTTCEPCPMCLAASHWARLKQIYYGCTREDAARIGFDDKFIYDVFKGAAVVNPLRLIQLDPGGCLAVFKEYEQKEDKIPY